MEFNAIPGVSISERSQVLKLRCYGCGKTNSTVTAQASSVVMVQFLTQHVLHGDVEMKHETNYEATKR